MTNDDVDVNEDDDHQHHFDSNASVTQLPCIQSDGKPVMEVTPIPTADSTKELPKQKKKQQQQEQKDSFESSDTITSKDTLNDVSNEQEEQEQEQEPELVDATDDNTKGNNNKNTKKGNNTKKGKTKTGIGGGEEGGVSTTSTTNSKSNKKHIIMKEPKPRPPMTGTQVAKDESKTRKIMIRILSGAFLLGIFTGSIYMGHLYVCLLVAFVEILLFRELVRVRYNAYFATIEDTIPLFRTTQWMWFTVAIFYTYGDFAVEVIQNNRQLHYLIRYAKYSTSLAFILYSGTFVLTIATMQVGHIKFQLNQLCWTVVVLCLTVGQMKYIMHNVFNGLFWFTMPILLVVTNDIMAYVSGMTCGRKFIQRQLISFSPNKTWEGFIGGGIFTIVAAWYLSRFLAQYTWMTCPTNEFRIFPSSKLECELDPIFQQAQSIIPPQIFEIFPAQFVKMFPGIVEICSVRNFTTSDDGSFVSTMTTSSSSSASNLTLTRCISGEPTHDLHHFELVLKNVFPIQIHCLWLAVFASFVAPFGGFLASAIKRAYGIKDFDSIIPGHGGFMDRMDCQFIMALCTWVHYNTFVKLATVSVPKLYYMYSLLSDAEKKEFLDQIQQSLTKQQRHALGVVLNPKKH